MQNTLGFLKLLDETPGGQAGRHGGHGRPGGQHGNGGQPEHGG